MIQRCKIFSGYSADLDKIDQAINAFLADGKQVLHQSACIDSSGITRYIVTIIYTEMAPAKKDTDSKKSYMTRHPRLPRFPV